MARVSDINESLKGRWDSLRPPQDELAYIDDLTGLFNYRLLSELLENRWAELKQNSDRFSLVMIDLDLFKQVNDGYGHLSGDEVLRTTARLLSKHFRADDLIFRYGGDEFAVLLPGAGSEDAELLGDRARHAMMTHEFFTVEERRRIEVPLSFCIGVASHPDDGEDGVALVHRADQRLYQEKKRNKRQYRRRKHLFYALLSAAALISIPLGVTFFFFDVANVTAPPDRSTRASRAPQLTPEMEMERQEFLRRIAELQQEVDEFLRIRESAPPSTEPAETAPAVTALERRIEELTNELETRSLVPGEARPTIVTGEVIDDPEEMPPPMPIPPKPAPGRVEPTPQPGANVTISAPRLIGPIEAEYPRVARHLGREAVVDLIVLVNDRGRVIHARTISPRVGFGFEKAALDAALASKWNPGARGGSPIEMEAPLRVSFKMRE